MNLARGLNPERKIIQSPCIILLTWMFQYGKIRENETHKDKTN
jgi:hypothetical protein